MMSTHINRFALESLELVGEGTFNDSHLVFQSSERDNLQQINNTQCTWVEMTNVATYFAGASCEFRRVLE
ncbi:hypothetical protein P3T76_004255 [Phytophthora citrophthora]|uniref:Uncharacterized protein n=1 Tax=Phytophthora citrophthora TaxID=4793 RepID=A0AAD9GUG5_9STRA|nr:hypothetical protein P3T76_004255 [Phytophthora citrophthora]